MSQSEYFQAYEKFNEMVICGSCIAIKHISKLILIKPLVIIILKLLCG